MSMLQNSDTNTVVGPIGIFATERLPLAIFLHAARRLLFARCERVGSGRVRFLFEDPDSDGPLAELEFEQGATVPARTLFASQTFLRRKMSEALENRRIGRQNEEERRSNQN